MNILDYLSWRGDLSFNASPFNEVDNLVISQMSYVVFEKYINIKEKYTIKELADIYFSNVTIQEIEKDKSFVSDAPYVLKKMAETDRFKDAVVHSVVSKTDKRTAEQFCAFSLDLADRTTFIVFRGTDDTLIGWKEDLNMSYTRVMAQEEAYKYLSKNVKPLHTYRIGGHSKGGNLAEYGVMWLPKEKQERILAIYSNDGPGNKSNVLPPDYKDIYKRIGKKLFKYVPEFDFFGTIYNNKYKPIVIKADGFAVYQHSATNWNVEGTKMIRGTAKKSSALIAKAFKEFLESVNAREKKEFVDELFDALDNANLKNMSDIINGGVPVIVKTIKKFGDMNQSSKETASKLLNAFVKQYKKDILENASHMKGTIIKTVQQKSDDVFDLLSNINPFVKK